MLGNGRTLFGERSKRAEQRIDDEKDEERDRRRQQRRDDQARHAELAELLRQLPEDHADDDGKRHRNEDERHHVDGGECEDQKYAKYRPVRRDVEVVLLQAD